MDCFQCLVSVCKPSNKCSGFIYAVLVNNLDNTATNTTETSPFNSATISEVLMWSVFMQHKVGEEKLVSVLHNVSVYNNIS